jgi:hypothetical protein
LDESLVLFAIKYLKILSARKYQVGCLVEVGTAIGVMFVTEIEVELAFGAAVPEVEALL